MNKKIKIPLYFLLSSITLVFTSGINAATEVVGVQFASTPYPGDFKMMVLNAQKPGGKLVVHVTTTGKKMIAFDDSLTEKNLKSEYIMKNGGKTAVKAGVVDVWPFVSFNKNNKAALIELHYKELPPASTDSIRTQGEIWMKVANKQIPVDLKNIKLKSGEKLVIGPVNLVIDKIGKPQWNNDYPVEVTFNTDEKFKQIAEIQFFDEKGKSIKSSRGSTMSMGFGGKKQVQVGYLLKRNVDKIGIKAVYWDGVEKKGFPLNVTIKRPF